MVHTRQGARVEVEADSEAEARDKGIDQFVDEVMKYRNNWGNMHEGSSTDSPDKWRVVVEEWPEEALAGEEV
jgi:hypothetical protein